MNIFHLSIHVIPHHVDPTVNAEPQMAMQFVHVAKTISEVLQLVDLSVLLVLTVPKIKLVSMKSAKIHVQELVA